MGREQFRSWARKIAGRTSAAMLIGLILAAALGGEAADPAPPQAYGPSAAQATAAPAARTTDATCVPPAPDANNSREIVVCGTKPQTYRINPDVLAAKRAKKRAMAGGPRPPQNFKDHSCAVVGPAPCIDAPMINLLAAAATAAEMGKRVAEGQEVGSMFVTDPQPTEYQLYQQAKQQREAKEAEAVAKAKSAAAKAAAAAASSATPAH